MASKRKDLCPNTQEELLAETKVDGSKRQKGEECPYCEFLIGAHAKEAAAAAGAVCISVSSLLADLQRALPLRPVPSSAGVFSSACATAISSPPAGPSSFSTGLEQRDDDSADGNPATAELSGRSGRRGRRSLARHSATLPPYGIPVAEFGSYLKFVNREQQCEALVTHLQSSYLTFRQRVQTPLAERAGPGEYLKSMQVVYSAGAPGIGKTTWARMALDHMPSSCALDARFQPVLDGCTQRGWRYRICFGEDVVSSDELAAPALSVAARLLWQHLKYELPRVSSVQSYDAFWRYLADRRLTFAPADVLEHICGSVVPAAQRMLLVNLDEINVLFSDHHSGASAPVTLQCQYLQHVLRSLLQLQIDGVAFVMPVLTATKALRVRELIPARRLRVCPLEIPVRRPFKRLISS